MTNQYDVFHTIVETMDHVELVDYLTSVTVRNSGPDRQFYPTMYSMHFMDILNGANCKVTLDSGSVSFDFGPLGTITAELPNIDITLTKDTAFRLLTQLDLLAVCQMAAVYHLSKGADV